MKISVQIQPGTYNLLKHSQDKNDSKTCYVLEKELVNLSNSVKQGTILLKHSGGKNDSKTCFVLEKELVK